MCDMPIRFYLELEFLGQRSRFGDKKTQSMGKKLRNKQNKTFSIPNKFQLFSAIALFLSLPTDSNTCCLSSTKHFSFIFPLIYQDTSKLIRHKSYLGGGTKLRFLLEQAIITLYCCIKEQFINVWWRFYRIVFCHLKDITK